MNGQTKKQINALAKTLPDVWIDKPVTKIYTGKEIMHKRIPAPGIEIILAKERYSITTKVPTLVDHVERIKKIYSGGGEIAVAKYVKHSIAIGKQQAAQKLNYKKPSRLQRLISRIKNLLPTWMRNTKA